MPSQALAKYDRLAGCYEIAGAFEKKFGKPPTTQYAYPIYAFLDMWAKAVTEAKTADAKPVVALLNKADNQPTVLGPRTFTPKLHVQTTEPMFVMLTLTEKRRLSKSGRSRKRSRDAVLYRLKGSE